MKINQCLPALLAALAAGTLSPLGAQAPVTGTPMPGGTAMPQPAPAATFVVGRMIRMRPEEKRPLVLKLSERNPYAKRGAQQEAPGEEGTNVEELKIRQLLTQLSVTGRSQGPNGLRVLLGDIILEQGTILPQLIEDQSENLSVVDLNEDTVVLGWLDIETGELTGKTMQVAYDLAPKVSYALHGRTADEAEGEPAQRLMGTMRIGKDRKKEEAGMVSRKLAEELPEEVYKAGQ